MTTELTYLAWVCLLTMVMWIPAGVNLILDQGLGAALGNRADLQPLAPWAERVRRAHTNAVENLVVFSALVLALHQAGATSAATATACAVYFWMRLAHYLVYVAGIPGLRTAVWSVAWGCQLFLAWQLLAA